MKFVTVVTTTPDYWTPFRVLVWSMGERGQLKGLDWHVLWVQDPPKDAAEIIEKCGFNPIFHSIHDFPAPPDFPYAKAHLGPSRYKLLSWLLEPDDTYCYIDADMVCLRDAREFLDVKPFAAMRRPGVTGFCGGLMFFKPDEKVFNYIKEDITPRRKWELSDQDVLNEYYTKEHPEMMTRLPWRFNTSKREEKRQSHWSTLLSEAIVLHYHGRHKPWLRREMGYSESHQAWHTANILFRRAMGWSDE